MVLDDKKAKELKGPPAIDGIGPTGRMDEYWKECDADRRKKSAWAA
jgi:phthalate 4,5-dioxygenase